jgi:hypothetical protein
MAQYETGFVTGETAPFKPWSEPQSAQIIATPQSTLALTDLAKASSEYAAAAEAFVQAREFLNGARSRWQQIRDAVAKATEQEGV